MKLIITLILTLSLTGCMDFGPAEPYPNPNQITTRQVEIEEYGLCTFAGVNGDWSDSMTLVGCKL